MIKLNDNFYAKPEAIGSVEIYPYPLRGIWTVIVNIHGTILTVSDHTTEDTAFAEMARILSEIKS